MELYKYTGSVAALTVRFGKAETITLYDSYDDSVAPVRLDVRGALAEYIKEIESTDSEERYMNLDWYYDFNMRILWDSFSDDEKPEWTSLEEIERFSKKMLEEEIY